MSEDDHSMQESGTDEVSTPVQAVNGVNRRKYLRNGALAVAASVGLAGCSGGSADSESSGTTTGSTESYPPVKFIETPGNTPADTRKQWEPFTEYLIDNVDGLEMEISFAQSYSAVGQALLNGQGHITSGDLVLLANPDQFDVLGIKVENGSDVYFSLMGTLPKYDIDEITDLKGKTVAFADRLSTSGSLFATKAMKEAGLDIGEAPYGDPVDYTGEWSNHDSAKQSVINREDVVALGTYAGNIIDHIPKDQFPDRVKEQSGEWGDSVGTKSPEMKLIETSAPIPKSPLIAPSDWEHPLRSDIEEAITSIDKGSLRNPDDVDAAITAINEGSVDDYQPVVDVLNELDVDMGDL